MKKMIAVLLVFGLICTGVFALDFAAGALVNFDQQTSAQKIDGPILSGQGSTSFAFIGGRAFFDAQYVLAHIGTSILVTKEIRKFNSKVSYHDATRGYIHFGILGKYPFKLGPLYLFPMAGVEFDVITLYKKGEYANDGLAKQDLNKYWLVAGLGADIPLGSGGKLFFRPQGTFGWQMNEPLSVKEWKEQAASQGETFSYNNFKFGAGLGVLYRF